MKAKLLFLFVFAAVLAGCKKSNYDTTPKVEIKSVKVGDLVDAFGNSGKFVELNLTVTDKEGDVQDSIIIDKIDAGTPACAGNSLLDDDYKMPEFPSEPYQKVNVRIRYSNINAVGYGLLSGNDCPSNPHVVKFRFTVRDKAGNRSVPVESEVLTLPF
jgi:hypothetical protein